MSEGARKPIIIVKNLTHVYPDGTLALDGINLEIYEGEFIGIIGQNGSGKTTLVKHFNGLLKPTEGEVLVDGVDTRNLTIAQLSTKVGYVFQNPDHQICQSTVFDEVAFGPRNLGLSEGEVKERVQSALMAIGIEKLSRRHPLLVSKGERQRIAVASVLAMRPKILIIDEPTTGQDYRQSKEIMDLVYELNKEGRTVIVISHNMKLIAEYVQRVIVFSQGKVILDGSARHVFSQHEILKKAFIRSPQITRLARMLMDYGIKPDILFVREMYEEFKKSLG
ncbi:MAG: ATP-binding cassette domain-containing protein [Candidatus Bathyarchaeia archaeon]